MGVMRFLTHPVASPDDWPEAFRGYITGFDGRIFPTRMEIDGSHLACRRPMSDSGKLSVSWPVPGYGRPVLQTASLREREEPYLLALELARGRISELRNQSSIWNLSGMELPRRFGEHEREAFRLFSQAATSQSDQHQACELAQQAIAEACRAADELIYSYAEQRLASLRARRSSAAAVFGCRLDASVQNSDIKELFCDTFDAAAIPISWRNIEPEEGTYNWGLYDPLVECCAEHRMLVRGGPLIDFGPNGLPDWVSRWKEDPLNLQNFVSDFVETAISRYIGRVRIWEVSAYGNTGGALGLAEETRLTLVARTLEIAQRIENDSKFFIRVDQPWGTYQARGDHRLSPLQFVDALIRTNLGLAGVNLEISVGYRPQEMISHDLFAFSRMLDNWSVLGIPLIITLAFPSSAETDPHADGDYEVTTPQWKQEWSEEAQADWLDELVPLLHSKQPVNGIYWTHLSDGQPHRYPNAGLLRPDGTSKPALEVIRKYQQHGD